MRKIEANEAAQAKAETRAEAAQRRQLREQTRPANASTAKNDD